MTDDRKQEVVIDYTNWRGERRERRIRPINFFFGTTPAHPEEQWFCHAHDIEKNAPRTFAMRDIHKWTPAPT
jgi:predicted DNA-binding transcriptional regulator YafY